MTVLVLHAGPDRREVAPPVTAPVVAAAGSGPPEQPAVTVEAPARSGPSTHALTVVNAAAPVPSGPTTPGLTELAEWTTEALGAAARTNAVTGRRRPHAVR